MCLSHRCQGQQKLNVKRCTNWQSLEIKCVNYVIIAKYIGFMYLVFTCYKGLSINMWPCLHTCCESKTIYATFVTTAQTNLCNYCVIKIAQSLGLCKFLPKR